MNTPHDHIFRGLDEEQQRVHDGIVRMGEMAAAQLEAALDVVARRDDRASARVVANDDAIDALEQEVTQEAVRLALRGPLARDLRFILAALRIAAAIERMGDYAANIAKRSAALSMAPPLPQVEALQALGRRAVDLIRQATDAYRDDDADLAIQARDADARIDADYSELYRDLVEYMGNEPRSITSATHLMFMAKNIERIGDHATNVAENVCYLVSGEDDLPPREKRDDSPSLAP